MPLYEYRCPSCGTAFEAYVGSWNQAVDCPCCGTDAVEKQISRLALVGASGPSASSGGGCGCGRGGCGCHS